MAYRDFVRPEAVQRARKAGAWLKWMEEQGEILVPVAPHQPLSCLRCYGTSRYRDDDQRTWPSCWNCGRVYGNSVDTVVPITYSLDAGLESMLHQYKDGAAVWMRRPLAALLTVFVREHGSCIDRDAGGIDIAMTMPSDNQQRGFDHLDRLLRGAVVGDPILDRFGWSSETIARDRSTPRPARGELKPDAYTVLPGTVRDAAVLLLDDTWTSGSSASSAGAALKAAGARHVTVLTLGRQLNVRDKFGSSEAIYRDRRAEAWTRDTCVLCA